MLTWSRCVEHIVSSLFTFFDTFQFLLSFVMADCADPTCLDSSAMGWVGQWKCLEYHVATAEQVVLMQRAATSKIRSRLDIQGPGSSMPPVGMMVSVSCRLT